MIAAALAVAALALGPAPALAEALIVWSAGALEPGLATLVESFKRETGHTVELSVAVPMALRQRIEDGGRPDVVIAPIAVIDALIGSGRVKAEGRAELGRVGVGVVVRRGTPVPDVSDPERLVESLLAAEVLVYNRASTGIYFDGLLKRLGIAEQVRAKSVRYADGVEVFEHLIRSRGREVGIGAITEVKAYGPRGIDFAGPLPAALQNYTTYAAGLVAGARAPDAAAAFVAFVASAAAREVFARTGVE